jgi:hypothetical protein
MAPYPSSAIAPTQRCPTSPTRRISRSISSQRLRYQPRQRTPRPHQGGVVRGNRAMAPRLRLAGLATLRAELLERRPERRLDWLLANRLERRRAEPLADWRAEPLAELRAGRLELWLGQEGPQSELASATRWGASQAAWLAGRSAGPSIIYSEIRRYLSLKTRPTKVMW